MHDKPRRKGAGKDSAAAQTSLVSSLDWHYFESMYCLMKLIGTPPHEEAKYENNADLGGAINVLERGYRLLVCHCLQAAS